ALAHLVDEGGGGRRRRIVLLGLFFLLLFAGLGRGAAVGTALGAGRRERRDVHHRAAAGHLGLALLRCGRDRADLERQEQGGGLVLLGGAGGRLGRRRRGGLARRDGGFQQHLEAQRPHLEHVVV